MKREELVAVLEKYFSLSFINSLLCGRRTPSYSKAQILYEKHGIPFEAWIDIKAFLATAKEEEDENVAG